MSKADTTGRGPEASEGRLIVFPLANKLVDPPPSKFIACIHPKLCIRWAISDIYSPSDPEYRPSMATKYILF